MTRQSETPPTSVLGKAPDPSHNLGLQRRESQTLLTSLFVDQPHPKPSPHYKASQVGCFSPIPDHLTCIPSVPCIRTSGSSTLFQIWSKFDYVMLIFFLQIYCTLIYHDLRVYDTKTIP